MFCTGWGSRVIPERQRGNIESHQSERIVGRKQRGSSHSRKGPLTKTRWGGGGPRGSFCKQGTWAYTTTQGKGLVLEDSASPTE